MRQILFTLFLLSFCYFSHGQAPQTFNYQGVARNLSGNSITSQNIGLRISILNGSPSGTEIYEETHNTSTTNLGLFNLQIGDGTVTSGNFQQIDWGSDSHFLQIEMDIEGGSNYELIGTSELLSVPYALYAQNSGDNIWTAGDGEIYHENSNVRMGPHTASTSDGFLSVVGFNGTETLSTGQTLNSLAKLVDLPSDGGGLRVQVSDGPDKSLFLKSAKNNSNIGLITRTNLVDYERLTISNEGNVGIGNNAPASKLHVSDGDIYIENITNGVIMKSPNGQCWRMNVTNSGQPTFTELTCPN